MSSFWKGKEPCWVLLDCSNYVWPNCPAYLNQEKPCWEHESTQCEKLTGVEIDCRDCRVFKAYHHLSENRPVNDHAVPNNSVRHS